MTEDRKTNDRILRLPEVLRRTSLSKTTIWELEKGRKFPRHFEITGTRAVGWSESAIDAWITALTAPATTTSTEPIEPTRRRTAAV